MAYPGWFRRAKCRNVKDPDIFFPNGNSERKIEEAKAICHTCPVESKCLAYATLRGFLGIWGGTDEKERDALLEQHIAVFGVG